MNATLTESEKQALGTFGQNGYPDEFTGSLIATVESILAARLPATTDSLAKAWDEGHEGCDCVCWHGDPRIRHSNGICPACVNPYDRAGLAHKAGEDE